MINSKLPKIWYGGDYNPDQWDKAIWDEDIRMFDLAGIDVVTINVFGWSKNQRDEHQYDFTWLDEMMDKLHAAGIGVCLGTSTAAHPAWMARKYPDVLQVDFYGRQRKFGGRHNSCPNSPTYRRFAPLMAEKLAARYKDHPALLIWHINNEYGGAGNCYCDHCEAAFRVWLKKRYGTLEAVNKAWNTGFWGHIFYDWEDIVLPSGLSEEWEGDNGRIRTNFQGISLDYMRFHSDSLLECYLLEYEAVKKYTPDIPVTTNMMGAFKKLDYHKWAEHIDIISWDNYPRIDTPPSYTAMMHDLMRGLKHGQPFMLMEQTPSQQNWQPYNSLKRPGVMRLWSYQAVSRGADTVLFFQLRRSVGACEKYHGAVIEHVGHEHTRVFRECAQLGKELEQLGNAIIGATVPAQVAIIFDWENWWAVELSSGPSIALQYVEEVHKYYKALYDQGIAVDLVSVGADISAYRIVIAPVMYMVKEGMAEKLENYVATGGHLVTTYFSGIVNESDLVTLGGYPGPLRQLLGIWAEEIDALLPTEHNRIVMTQQRNKWQETYSCGLLCDLIHPEGAEVVAVYGDDFYQGMPALTRHSFGAGTAWYMATSPEQQFLHDWLGQLCRDTAVKPLLHPLPTGVEVIMREKEGQQYLFVMNHQATPATIQLGEQAGMEILSNRRLAKQDEVLNGRDVWIIKQ